MDNFIVSARKYRPATFESVVGQGHITATLKNAISRGQLAHAYLFCGPRGVGKTTCARIFAKAINCLSPVDSEACGECESCRSFNEGRSFNIHELDAASNNSVDDIRSLTEQVRIPPQIGRYSVYIIDEVHMLSTSAFNAFLKTLEEPPAHAIFILATTEKHKIIPTILSRCQIYDFNRIRVEDVVNYLKYIANNEGVRYDDESLHLIAQKADGGMRDALSMFDKAVSFCGNDLKFKEVARTLNVLDYDTYFNITSLILSGNYPSVLTAFDEVLRNGFNPQTFVGGLNAHFRDLLMGKNSQTAPLLEVTGELLERYKRQGTECDVGFLFDAIAVLTAVDGGLRTATNQRLNVELGLMKLCGLGQKKNNFSINATSRNQSDNASASKDTALKSSVPFSVGSDPMKIEVPLPELTKKQVPLSDNTTREIVNPPSPAVGQKQDTVKNDGLGTVVKDKANRASADSNHISKPENKSSQVVKDVVSGMGSAADTHAYLSEEVGNASAAVSDRAKDIRSASVHVASKIANGHTISGASISSLLNTPKSIHDIVTDDAGMPIDCKVDPESEAKISKVRDRFLSRLDAKWPRIAVSLGNMTVSGNKISATVSTKTLYEDIMRNRSEILSMLCEMAGIEGVLELSVDVRQESAASRRPIKAEDKAKFLAEQNPALNMLRKKLDLDLE